MKKVIFFIFGALFLVSLNSYGQDPPQDMLELADKLESCEAYSQTFTHPFTGESLERKVLGLVDEKCSYLETMPNGGRLECKYLEESRKAVAKYYRDTANAKSVGTKATISQDKEKQKVKYTIDGKEVKNPLQESMNNGTCVISGY